MRTAMNNNRRKKALLLILLGALSFDLAGRQNARLQAEELASRSSNTCDVKSQLEQSGFKSAECDIKKTVKRGRDEEKVISQRAKVTVVDKQSGTVVGEARTLEELRRLKDKPADKPANQKKEEEYLIEVTSPCDTCTIAGSNIVSSDRIRITATFEELKSRIEKLSDENAKAAVAEGKKATQIADCEIDEDGKKLKGKEKLECQIDNFDKGLDGDDEKKSDAKLKKILAALSEKFEKGNDEERAWALEKLEELGTSVNLSDRGDRAVQFLINDMEGSIRVRDRGQQLQAQLTAAVERVMQFPPLMRFQASQMYVSPIQAQINAHFGVAMQGQSLTAREHGQHYKTLQHNLKLALSNPERYASEPSLVAREQIDTILGFPGRSPRARFDQQNPLLYSQQGFQGLLGRDGVARGNPMIDQRHGCAPGSVGSGIPRPGRTAPNTGYGTGFGGPGFDPNWHPMGPGHYPGSTAPSVMSMNVDPYCLGYNSQLQPAPGQYSSQFPMNYTTPNYNSPNGAIPRPGRVAPNGYVGSNSLAPVNGGRQYVFPN